MVVAARPAFASSVIADMALSAPFGTRSPWHFTATQDPPATYPELSPDEKLPGGVHFCLKKGDGLPCDALVVAMVHPPAPLTYSDWEPHDLRQAAVVHSPGPPVRPLLLLRTASLNSVDGDQVVYLQLLAYRAELDRFTQVYAHATTRNNNQEIRYVETGKLAGSVILAEPTSDAPFAFWISVDKATPEGAYKTILKYRSATRYGDGNPLAVIDSEMPNIVARLGFWRPGAPLPLPAGPCPRPRLVRSELWCQ